ncbi:hypothetical protein KCP76_05255 [Salmonella enterica subsp. enterica serovar Weltevreden]|nr:hypothetical protein KCP76_05255 [Salmonella enterica subsp. enterica serovar Weltevreden]
MTAQQRVPPGRAAVGRITAARIASPARQTQIFRQLINVKGFPARLYRHVNDAPPASGYSNESHPWEAFEFPAGQHPDERDIPRRWSAWFACAGRRAKKNDGTALRFSGMYFSQLLQ